MAFKKTEVEPLKKAPDKVSEFSVEKKIKEIESSTMPQYQKKQYIDSLTGKRPDLNGVPFTVWANVRKMRESVKAGMAVYATSKGMTSLMLSEWDEFFKNY